MLLGKRWKVVPFWMSQKRFPPSIHLPLLLLLSSSREWTTALEARNVVNLFSGLISGPIDCSPPSSSVYGILQARILDQVAIPFSRECSRSRYWSQVCCSAGRFFSIWVIYGKDLPKGWLVTVRLWGVRWRLGAEWQLLSTHADVLRELFPQPGLLQGKGAPSARPCKDADNRYHLGKSSVRKPGEAGI